MKLASELGIAVSYEEAHANNNQEAHDTDNDSYYGESLAWLCYRKCEGL